MNLSKTIADMLELEKRATERCGTCGSRVGIYTTKEGTGSYEPFPVDKLVEIAEALREAKEILEDFDRRKGLYWLQQWGE